MFILYYSTRTVELLYFQDPLLAITDDYSRFLSVTRYYAKTILCGGRYSTRKVFYFGLGLLSRSRLKVNNPSCPLFLCIIFYCNPTLDVLSLIPLRYPIWLVKEVFGLIVHDFPLPPPRISLYSLDSWFTSQI